MQIRKAEGRDAPAIVDIILPIIHVCNCGYMTRASETGRGVARSMCEHSLVMYRLL